MEEKVIEKVEEKIKEVLDTDVNPNNIEYLYKLSKIKHMAKEDKEMNYGNYGNYGRRYDAYGEYRGGDNYGRRGYDMKYRGGDSLDRMSGEYGRYRESYNRYGAGEETDRSFHYMVKALEDFIKVLHEEAETPQQKQMLRESLQNCMM